MSRLPLKSYEKTPLRHDSQTLKYQSDNIFSSSHISLYSLFTLLNIKIHINRKIYFIIHFVFIEKNLFTTTTIKNYSIRNHNETEIEETSNFIQSKTSKVIKYMNQSIKIFIEFITYYYFISTFILTKIFKSIMGKIYKLLN